MGGWERLEEGQRGRTLGGIFKSVMQTILGRPCVGQTVEKSFN